MNIQCMTDQVKIDSKCIQNIDDYKLGNQTFYDSVTTSTINYSDKQENDVCEDLDNAYRYFKNLKSFDLENLLNLPLIEIIEIISNCKINHASFEHKSLIQNSYLPEPYWIESKGGCLILYDSTIQLSVN